MGVKYYTHFVLTGASGRSSAEEFSGVVEINQPTAQHYDPDEIEALLARNLETEGGQVRLIDWSRLQ